MKISVIMPVYNSEAYLDVAINSVLSQNVDLEIIAVDDCSTDSSRNILLEISERDSRVKAYFNESNIGVASVRNKALGFAEGEYVAFCDSDDILPSGAYAALISEACGYDIVVGAHADLYDDGTTDPVCRVNKNDRESLFKSLFTVSCLWTKLIRREFITSNGLSFDPKMKIGEDVVFLANAVTKDPKHKVIDDLVYYHCQHDVTRSRSLTHIYTFEAFKKHIECREKILNILGERGEVEDFVYLNFSSFIADFILRMNDSEDLDDAFDIFKHHILRYRGFAENRVLFKALFGVEYDVFSGMSASEYTERVRTVLPREHVLSEYQAGRIGFAWIIKYFKAWLGFKLRRGK